MAKNYYITFENHEQALVLLEGLKGEGISATIAPTPREISMCCGVCVMVRESGIERTMKFLSDGQRVYKSIEGIEQEFNPRRDKYL